MVIAIGNKKRLAIDLRLMANPFKLAFFANTSSFTSKAT